MTNQTLKIASSHPVSDNSNHYPVYEIPKKVLETIQGCAKGSYQEDLLDGLDSWSGGSLRGMAAYWGASYHDSRIALLERINAALSARYLADTALVFDVDNRRWTRQLVLFRGRKAAIVGQFRP